MSDYEGRDNEEIFSKVLRAGRRTYFFDVRSTKAGDYYLTITESKKFTNDDGSFHFKKHKIYLYKEDFAGFTENLNDMTSYILDEKGEEVISDRHQNDYSRPEPTEVVDSGAVSSEKPSSMSPDKFTDVSFDDI
ncbi:uncharacterized protein DUF3276 [Dokdonia sp. Hel_I_63]|jgi:hypothetical protein|uniref:PUR family DNA/RNA-binding protein n=1 Tax=unclassified Dokdonia TaxID=2615033 RepID=UPI00020A62F2|nr:MULTISPECIES: PUR family DNA/RNA-binding protein [unclassified Dokdonia]AEE20546.1 PUR-alpha/beta/gamma DNA/RNA-binding protein [Dokdonia sp. 4H-3-7-5]TVZ23199.1 uncharacterized protein DUF3276 [Dokdonia sp. Hel_I_63]